MQKIARIDMVFDVTDNLNGHTGLVLNFGRIGLQPMDPTVVCYRRLIIDERKN